MAAPTGADLYIDQARWLTAEGRLADALGLLGRAIAENPHDSYLRAELASLLLAMGRAGDALREAEAAVALAPDAEWPHRLVAFAWLQIGNPRQALVAADAAIWADPASPHALKARFEAQLALGLRSGATQTARIAREMAPDDAWPKVDQARVALASKQAEKAEVLLRAVLYRDPQNSGARNLLALALRAQGRHLEALPELATTLRSDPDSPLARRQLMRAVDRHLGVWPVVALVLAVLLGARGLEFMGLRGREAIIGLAAITAVSAAAILRLHRRRASQIPTAVWEHYREERGRTRLLRSAWVIWIVATFITTGLAVAGLAGAAQALHSRELQTIAVIALLMAVPAWRAAAPWAWRRYALPRLGG